MPRDASGGEEAGPVGRSYAFVSVWQVDAPIQAVWDAIYHSERWPHWWPYVAAVDELAPGDSEGLGEVRRYTWTTQLPYKLVFESTVTRVEPPRILEASVHGQLVGTGRWRLTRTECGTLVRYDWNIRTRVDWMNALAPIARPFFAWNHDVVMRAGGRGLGRLLKARVQAGSLEEVQA
ncbi:MAG TPA: SRPBCC family protein [Chloroflexota bacterium]